MRSSVNQRPRSTGVLPLCRTRAHSEGSRGEYCQTPVPAVAVIQVVPPVRLVNGPKGYVAGRSRLEYRGGSTDTRTRADNQ